MSSKIKAIGKEIAAAQEKEPVKTKNMTVRIDVRFSGHNEPGSTYMLITGVPEDLPVEYEGTVLRTAEGQFAQALNQRKFLEIYPQGKSSKDGTQPTFINLDKVETVDIVAVEKVD